jgi:hypothetical protein
VNRVSESGAAVAVVMVLVSALLTAGALAVHLAVGDTRATGYAAASRSALYCAEAGLASARALIGASYASWPLLLDDDPANDPSWYPIRADLDAPADGVTDFEVTIRDNDDELAPVANDPRRDNDLRVFVVSRCTRHRETPRQVLELITYEGGGNVYRNQSGQGAGNAGNVN